MEGYLDGLNAKAEIERVALLEPINTPTRQGPRVDILPECRAGQVLSSRAVLVVRVPIPVVQGLYP